MLQVPHMVQTAVTQLHHCRLKTLGAKPCLVKLSTWSTDLHSTGTLCGLLRCRLSNYRYRYHSAI